MKFKELLYTNANTLGIFLSDAELEKFERYFNLLIEWNKKINLTAITDEEGVINKHFIDCLLIFKHAQIPENAKIIDIGSGAGFLGVVMKIYRNDINNK